MTDVKQDLEDQAHERFTGEAANYASLPDDYYFRDRYTHPGKSVNKGKNSETIDARPQGGVLEIFLMGCRLHF